MLPQDKLPQDKLSAILRRHDLLSGQLNETSDGEVIVQLSRELAELDPVVAEIRDLDQARSERDGIEAMLAEPQLDSEMRTLAEEEREEGCKEAWCDADSTSVPCMRSCPPEYRSRNTNHPNGRF